MIQCERWRKPGIGCTYTGINRRYGSEILLAHSGSIQTLKAIHSFFWLVLPSPWLVLLSALVRYLLKVLERLGQPSTAKWNPAQADALAAVQQIT